MKPDPIALLETLTAAIERAVNNIASEPHTRLIGFALCTDDDVMTLFDVHRTAPAAAATEPPGEFDVFEFWEWLDTSRDPDFDHVSQALSDWSDQTTSIEAADERFSILVEAMARNRDKGVFDANTFLCVSSTDPDEHARKLAEQAIRRLNLEATAAKFLAYVGWDK